MPPFAPFFRSTPVLLTTATTASGFASIEFTTRHVDVGVPLKTTAAAAALESFYRSGLNSKINYRLTGIRTSLFPNMHVQLPTRVVYITGFKTIRAIVDKYLRPQDFPGKELGVQALAAITPGVVMTPVSSILEACNATTSATPLYKRWVQGISARCGREVVFGIGLNQLTDHMETMMPASMNPALRNASACLTAGVLAGYFSHIPHNLSTLKLINPQRSYGQHLLTLAEHYRPTLARVTPNTTAQTVGSVVLAVVAPRGLMVRTAQVVGTFIILNGFIQAFKDIIN